MKEFCTVRSSLVAELTAATKQVTNIMDRLKVLAAHGNRVSAEECKEILDLSNRRNTGMVKCGRLLQKLGAHRAKHDC